VGSHEREERSELVKLNKKVVRWLANEPGYVTATKRLASDAVLEQHNKATFQFGLDCVIVSGPVSTEFLTTHKIAASKDKRPLVKSSLAKSPL
jgi:hypothetical protein